MSSSADSSNSDTKSNSEAVNFLKRIGLKSASQIASNAKLVASIQSIVAEVGLRSFLSFFLSSHSPFGFDSRRLDLGMDLAVNLQLVAFFTQQQVDFLSSQSAVDHLWLRKLQQKRSRPKRSLMPL